MRSTLAIVLFGPLLIGSAPRCVQAQFPEDVYAGVRVRVWIPEPFLQDGGAWKRQQLRGTLAAVTPDSLHVALPGTAGTISIARASVRRLDVSRGRPSRAASALERAFAGAVVGAISVALDNDRKGADRRHYTSRWEAAAAGAALGAAFGATVGFILPTERWRRIRLSAVPAVR